MITYCKALHQHKRELMNNRNPITIQEILPDPWFHSNHPKPTDT
jgi:hypothetical protein